MLEVAGKKSPLSVYLFSIDLDICDVVLEDCWHVNLWELILAEDDEEASLTAGTVAHDDQLLANGGHSLLLSFGFFCTSRENK